MPSDLRDPRSARHSLIWLLGVTLLFGLMTIAFPGVTPSARASPYPGGEPNYPPPPSYPTSGPAVLTVAASGGGSVVSTNVGGINCPGSCAVPYNVGTWVNLVATPSPGYVFTGWSGDCSGAGTICSVYMDRYRYVTATFRQTLTIIVHGPGTVTSSPPGITCGSGGSACSATFNPGESVTLTATPDAGKVFYSWSSSCPPDLGTGPCPLTMDGPKQVDAWFGDDVEMRVLTVSLPSDYSPSPGLVTSTPDLVYCRNDTFFGWTGCWGLFPLNSTVSLNANPFGNSFLVGWEGDGIACGSAQSCMITMDSNHAVGARFAKQSQLVLNLHKDPNFPGGSVAVGAPVNYTCSIPEGANDLTCSWWLPLASPTEILLTAQPDPGSTFYWQQACWGSNPACSPTIGGGNTTTVDTYFLDHLTINAGSIDGGQGQVNISPPGNPAITTCTAQGTCLITYLVQTTVTLTAVPDGNSRFDWGDNENTACYGVQPPDDCTFTVYPGQPVTVDAHFYPNPGAMKKWQKDTGSVNKADVMGETDAPRVLRVTASPNPVSHAGEFSISLPAGTGVSLRLFRIDGKQVQVLAHGWYPAGVHRITWKPSGQDHRRLAPAVYLYRLETDQGVRSGKVLVMR